MKRLALLICLMMCVVTVIGYAASFVVETDYIGDMEVVNCKQWVSLRKRPSTSATRLDTVPLGAIVTDCRNMSGDFIMCTYRGQTGYILKKYLTKLEPIVPKTSDKAETEKTNVPAIISVSTISPDGTPIPTAIPLGVITPLPVEAEATPEPEDDPLGKLVNESKEDGNTVKAYRRTDEQNEVLTILCLSAGGDTLWEYETTAAKREEGDAISVFMGDRALSVFILVYNPDEGLTLLFSGSPMWVVPAAELELKGDIVYAVNSDNTIFIGASEGPDPVAVNIMGEILWRADSEGCTGLYQIYADEFGLICNYSAIDGDPEADGYVFFDASGLMLEKNGAAAGSSSSGFAF